MNHLERRLTKIETEQNTLPLTAEDVRLGFATFLTKHGITREQAISKHGSLSEFAYFMMNTPSADDSPMPDDGRTPQEKYMAMIGR